MNIETPSICNEVKVCKRGRKRKYLTVEDRKRASSNHVMNYYRNNPEMLKMNVEQRKRRYRIRTMMKHIDFDKNSDFMEALAIIVRSLDTPTKAISLNMIHDIFNLSNEKVI
jgi:hypothetical protein